VVDDLDGDFACFWGGQPLNGTYLYFSRAVGLARQELDSESSLSSPVRPCDYNDLLLTGHLSTKIGLIPFFFTFI